MTLSVKPIASCEETMIVPSWITNSRCIEEYRLGVSWFYAGHEEREGSPLTEKYLLDNLKWLSKSGYFNGKRDLWAAEHLSFILGMLSQQQ